MREAIENIVRSLRFLEFEDEQHDHRSVVFKGMTAEAFKETAKDIKKSLTDLQSISSAVVGVFDKFEVKHKILREKEIYVYCHAKGLFDEATAAEYVIRRLENASAQGNGLSNVQVQELSAARLMANHPSYHSMFKSTGKSPLERLADFERHCERELIDDLMNISFGSLRDPGWLEKAWDATYNAVLEPFDEIWDAAWAGDWGSFWYELKDVLAGLAAVASIVSIVFPPAGLLALGLAGANFLIGATLLATDTKSDDGTRSMSWQQLTWEGLTFAASAASTITLLKSANLSGVMGKVAQNKVVQTVVQSKFINSKTVQSIAFKPRMEGSTISRVADFMQGTNEYWRIPYTGNATFAVPASRLSQVYGELYPIFGDVVVSSVFPKPQEIIWNYSEISL